MNKLDFAAINDALNPETVVPQWLPDGRRVNAEWVAPNPTRNDKNPGSFSINLKTGRWKDFATGDSGKDLISLYAYIQHDDDQGAAARELADNHGIRLDAPTRQRAAENVRQIEDAQPQLVLPVPPHATAPKFWHPRYGDPAAHWAYRNKEGHVLLYVARYEPEGERKQILPRSWCKLPDGTEAWKFKGFKGGDKRPLYGLDRLQDMPDADVLMVEGEKTADAGQELMADACTVVTWLGGVESSDKVSVKPLAGRRVILWPDFDAQRMKLTKDEADAGVDPASKPMLPMHEQPGMRAMMNIAQALKGVAREVILVGYTIDEERAGWDLADAKAEGWTGADVLKYMGARAGDPAHISSGNTAAPAPAPTPTPANDNVAAVPLEFDVNPFGFPHRSDKGQPVDSLENLEYLLGEYGIQVRYNVISKDVEISIPGRTFSRDNRAAVSLATIESLCARNRMPRGSLMQYITVLADANEYNPAAEWIDTKPWDSVDRIGALAATLDPLDHVMATALMRRWMIGAVACVYQPEGMSMQGALVLQGAQGAGKTTWFWQLAGNNKKLAKEGVSLNPADRDSVKAAISYWLVELGELDATFRKSDIAALKSFITKDTDEIFLRYSRASSTFPRRTAFFGTVNPEQYLHDETGNRRYWTIKCGAKLNPFHGIDTQQAWAQAKALFLQGEQHNLTPIEMDALNETNTAHTEANPIEDLILARFDWDGYKGTPMSASEVLLAIGYKTPNNKQAKDAGAILRKVTGGEPKKSNGRSIFMMPPRKHGYHDGHNYAF